jgi:hypothetical protein
VLICHGRRLQPAALRPVVVEGASKSTYALTGYTNSLGVDGTAKLITGANATWPPCVHVARSEHAAAAYVQQHAYAFA